MNYLSMTLKIAFFDNFWTLRTNQLKEKLRNGYSTQLGAIQYQSKVRRILPQGDEAYHFLEMVLEKPGIVIVIDKKTPELEEILDQLHITTNTITQILEFITYQNNTSKRLYLYDMLCGTPEKVVSQRHVSDTWV